MKLTIHQTIDKVTQFLENVDNLTHFDLKFFNINNYIIALTNQNFDECDEYVSLFDLIPYTEGELHDTTIKVCKKLIWYMRPGFDVRIPLNITEEEFFQQSTVQDFGDMIYETIINCNKLINILGKIHGNELRSKA
jgi:hypothetical protein